MPLTTRPDWTSLARGLAGELLLDHEARRAAPPFRAWFDQPTPEAVVCCRDTNDVADAIAFARYHGLETAVRSGGHCYAGFSTCTGLVIDVTPLATVTLDDGIARVGAGVRTGELIATLAERGAAIPTGTCPTVGIAGLTLGGGMGILSRSDGLTCDRLVAAELVLADGSVVECDEQQDAQLFWALRGAGAGNFGVVTALSFRTRAAPRLTNFQVTWPFSHAAEVIDAWQHWAPASPKQVACDLSLVADVRPASKPLAIMSGAFQGEEAALRRLLDGLRDRIRVEPLSETISELDYRESCAFHAPQGEQGGYRFLKSEFFDRPLPGRVLASLVAEFATGCLAGQERSLFLSAWGGAHNEPASDATAFVHRDDLFLLEHEASVALDASRADKLAAHAWLTRSWATVHRHGTGRVYPNFPDPELVDWGRAYYADNYPRLVEIKRAYDPDNVFRFDQSIPPS